MFELTNEESDGFFKVAICDLKKGQLKARQSVVVADEVITGRQYGIAFCDTIEKRLGGYLPYVSTEHEVLMLANGSDSGREMRKNQNEELQEVSGI